MPSPTTTTSTTLQPFFKGLTVEGDCLHVDYKKLFNATFQPRSSSSPEFETPQKTLSERTIKISADCIEVTSGAYTSSIPFSGSDCTAISAEDIEGELDISNVPNLERFTCNHITESAQVTLHHLPNFKSFSSQSISGNTIFFDLPSLNTVQIIQKVVKSAHISFTNVPNLNLVCPSISGGAHIDAKEIPFFQTLKIAYRQGSDIDKEEFGGYPFFTLARVGDALLPRVAFLLLNCILLYYITFQPTV